MLKKVLNKDVLLKNVFTLVKGTVLAQIISILAQPVLRRVFTPEDFGVFALYVALVSILSVIATGRLEMAIVLPKKDEEANLLFKMAIAIAFIFSLFLFVISFFISDHIINYILNEELIHAKFKASYTWLKFSFYMIPIGVFLLSTYNTFNYWFTRKEKYNKIVNVKIAYSISNVSSTGAMGFYKLSFGGIILGYLFSQILGVLYFLYLKQKESVKCAKVKYIALMKNYIDFPTKSLVSGLLNILASQLPIIIIGSFFGMTVVGLYEIIIRILNIPITMIGKSVSQVFYQKISKDVNDEKEIGSYVRSFSIKLFLFMLIPMSVIFFFGESLFAFAFGEQYRISGNLAAYFSLFFLIRFVYYSQSTLYSIKRKLGVELRQNAIYLIAQVSALLVGYYYFHDYKTTFILLAMSGFLCYLFFVYSLLKLAKS